MARKRLDFSNPLLSAENEPTVRRTAGRPRREDIIRNEEGGNSTQEGLTADLTRFSVVCTAANVKDLKDYAFTKRQTIGSSFDEILEKFFKEYRSNPKNEPLLDHTRGGKKK